MPVYQYACTECGEQLEVRQSFTDAALTECPACAGRLRKVLNAVGVVFKGSGFYRNDSRAAANGSGDSGGGASGAESGGGQEGTSKKGESTSSGSTKEASTGARSGSEGTGSRGARSGTAGPAAKPSDSGGGGKPTPAAAR